MASQKPADIPAAPNITYENDGWSGWSDWLDAERHRGARWRPFKEARAFVRSLGLKNVNEWRNYCGSGRKPNDIPRAADYVYAKHGWSGWGDWFGTGRRQYGRREYRSFKKARAFVRRLGLKSKDEWFDYCKSGKKPNDIPAHPHNTYAEAGWAGWGDWLGTGYVVPSQRQYRPFKKARAFVRRLGLKSQTDWFDYSKLGKKPNDIPAGPYRVYAKDGWSSWGDWLGTGRIADQLRQFRSFKKARSFVRRLGLKSTDEWLDYCKSGKKPNDIPSHPNNTYAKSGWVNWGDWLGKRETREIGINLSAQTIARKGKPETAISS